MHPNAMHGRLEVVSTNATFAVEQEVAGHHVPRYVTIMESLVWPGEA